jgi:uncharacterized protein (TIGR02246 family)
VDYVSSFQVRKAWADSYTACGELGNPNLSPREETMKMRSAVALVVLATNFALATLAKQRDTVDPQIAQQIRALNIKYDEAYNRNDAAAVAALYTEDAILVTPRGTISGRQAIDKWYAEYVFRQEQSTNHVTKVDRVVVVGNEVRSSGKWSCNFREHGGNTKQAQGRYSWVLVREGDAWKIRKGTYREFVGG